MIINHLHEKFSLLGKILRLYSESFVHNPQQDSKLLYTCNAKYHEELKCIYYIPFSSHWLIDTGPLPLHRR